MRERERGREGERERGSEGARVRERERGSEGEKEVLRNRQIHNNNNKRVMAANKKA